MVGHDVSHRHARELGTGSQHLLDLFRARLLTGRGVEAEALVAEAPGRRLVVIGLLRAVLS